MERPYIGAAQKDLNAVVGPEPRIGMAGADHQVFIDNRIFNLFEYIFL